MPRRAMAQETTYRPFPPFAQWADLPVDLKYWHQSLADLQALREKATAAQIEEAARYVTRATAVDTAAIEGLYAVDRGFTLSVAAQSGTWESEFDEKGGDARQHFEAQLQAAELVLDAATHKLPVVEALIRSLHEHVCAAQETYRVLTPQGWQDQPLAKGEYKRQPNNPSRADGQLAHVYAPVEEVRSEMERLVAELRSEAFGHAPAPVQAAFAHHAFVSIHPFADGNGRVARALASIYLVRATSVPFLLFADERPSYFDALEAADRGSNMELSERIRDWSTRAMNYMALSLLRSMAPTVGELREGIWRLHYAAVGLTHEQVNSLAEGLLDHVVRKLRAAFEHLQFPELLSLSMDVVSGESFGPPADYRRLRSLDPPTLQIWLKSPPPALGRAGARLRPLVSMDHRHPLPVRIEDQDNGAHFDAGLNELYPEMSIALEANLCLWVETLLARLVEEVIRMGQLSRTSSR